MTLLMNFFSFFPRPVAEPRSPACYAALKEVSLHTPPSLVLHENSRVRGQSLPSSANVSNIRLVSCCKCPCNRRPGNKIIINFKN